MTAKTFEIRDSMTFIPALAVQLDYGCEKDRYLLARAGFGTIFDAQRNYIILYHLTRGVGHYNQVDWDLKNGRTMQIAHVYIEKHFDDLESGAVIDVEFILEETKEAKRSEQDGLVSFSNRQAEHIVVEKERKAIHHTNTAELVELAKKEAEDES